MGILDTQIISYKYKETKDIDVFQKSIPSIVAIEFLQMQSSKLHAANYYIPKSSRYPFGYIEMVKIDHAFRQHSSDFLIFDFGQTHKSFKMFSNLNISELINSRNVILFDKAISFIKKDLQKELKKKIRFIVDNEINCEPITENDIEMGYALLDRFLSINDSKKDFRNTWNDILILSKSIGLKDILYTEDKLLKSFASIVCNANTNEREGIFSIDFTDRNTTEKKFNLESKGYINNGWKYKMIKNSTP